MSQFLEVSTKSGAVLIQIAPALRSDTTGFQPAGVAGDAVKKLKGSLQEAFQNAAALAEEALTQIGAIATTPQEVQLEFGMSFSATGSVIVSSGSAEASFKISMTWRRP